MDSSLSPRPKSHKKSKYFGKEILCMKLFGLSLTGNEGVIYKIYSFTFLTATIFLYPILDFCEYFKHDFSGNADIVIYQVAGVMAFCKVVVVFRNRVKLRNLLAKLEQEPFLANAKRGGDKEQELIDECVWITNLQTYTYWITASVVIVASITYGFTKRLRSSDYHDWQFPYGAFTVLNVTYSPNYEITYFYQSISIVFFAGLFTSVDLLLAAVLAHACYQFKILQNHLRRMVELSYEEMVKDNSELKLNSPRTLNLTNEIDVSAIPWSYLKNAAKQTVRYHLAIIGIAAGMEEAFSGLFLLVFLGTLALICFSVYAVTAFGSNPQILVRHLMEGFCACLQVGTICFWGEQIRHESQEVGRAVWQSNFVGTDLRFQKTLVLIIRRSQNPVKVTAGKFAEICLDTFTWILRASYSSFMLLRNASTNAV